MINLAGDRFSGLVDVKGIVVAVNGVDAGYVGTKASVSYECLIRSNGGPPQPYSNVIPTNRGMIPDDVGSGQVVDVQAAVPGVTFVGYIDNGRLYATIPEWPALGPCGT